MPEYPQVISRFEEVKITNVTAKGHKEVSPERKAAIRAGEAMNVGERVHLNCTPVDANGVPYPGYSDVVNSEAFKKEDGKSPIIEWQWYCGDKELSNSGNDPFEFGSYEPDGCTPTLTLREQVGPGPNEIHARPFVRGKYNGGVAVTGRAVVFKAD